jgi:hypothetical protein
MPQEPLLASNEPSFFQYYNAASYFLGFPTGAPGGRAERGVVFRHQDMRGRITRVLFGNERVHVECDGSDLEGLILEVAGNAPGPTRRLSRSTPHSADFSFPEGLPAGAWVLLRTEERWLDRRFLKWPYSREDQVGVEEEQIEPDPTSMIDYFLYQREGQQLEFKRALPEPVDELVKRVMKTVAAFANGDGGRILFGITKEYEVIGIDASDSDNDRDRLSDLIDDWVSPRPRWGFETYPLDDRASRVVLALVVQPGTEPPYSIGTKNVPTQYYVRHAGRSVPARPDELRGLARGRPPIAAPGHPPFS